MELHDAVKILRWRNKQSLQEVANAIDSSKSHVWEIELNRQMNPTIDTVKKLARHFKITTSQLIGEKPFKITEREVLFLKEYYEELQLKQRRKGK